MKKLFENWRKYTNEAMYEPGRAVSGIDTEIEKEDSLDMQNVNDQLLSDLQDLGMDWIMDDEEMYRILDRLKADSNSSGEYQQKIVDFLNNNADELGYTNLGDEVLNEHKMNEGTVPHSAHHVVKKMKKTGLSAKEALKSLTTDLSDEEAERWLKRHKDEMESAKQKLASR